ncbi:protein FAM221B isoform X2 [Symphalangus syndactylus]|uniref:protein FAM221B isoform X2 n=1 Tax=Symphalangus syndactylus TaxID=9590 RepID=UPI002441931D|nr:protein FAM221B isoform X3 [Symphalangus syndactylus]
MEAHEIIEEPHTTMDAEEHPPSKDPSAEDLQENHISESFLEPSTSETPLEPHTSASPLVPSPSQIPLEAHSPETRQEPSISDTPSETPTYEASLYSPTSVVPEKHLTLPPQSRDYVSLSSSDTLKEDLPSESSSNEVPWTRRSTHLSESESLPEHSFSGPSAQVQVDTSKKQEEEAGEVENGVDASDSTAHTAQPGHQLGKKKKKGVSCNTAHPVFPAKQTELVEVAKAMHREGFGAQVNNLFQWEKDAALNAIQTDRIQNSSSGILAPAHLHCDCLYPALSTKPPQCKRALALQAISIKTEAAKPKATSRQALDPDRLWTLQENKSKLGFSGMRRGDENPHGHGELSEIHVHLQTKFHL